MCIIFYPRVPASEERKKEKQKERKRHTFKYYFVRKSFVLVYHHNFLLHALAMCRVSLCIFRRVESMFSKGFYTNKTLNPFRKKKEKNLGFVESIFRLG